MWSGGKYGEITAMPKMPQENYHEIIEREFLFVQENNLIITEN